MPIYFDKQKERWRFTFVRRISGRRYRASKLLPAGWNRTRAEAFDRKETARIYALAVGIEQRDPLIQEAVSLYRKHRLPTQRAGTKAERHLAALQPYYHDRPLSELPAIFRQYVQDQTGALSTGTIHNRLAYLKAACRYAWKHHSLTDRDPTERVIVPPANNARHVYLTFKELGRLLKAFDDKEARAVCKIAFYTGLRWISELLPRQPQDIKRRGRERWLLAGQTKNGTPRMVPINPKISEDIKRLPFERHWRDYYAAFERARKRAGLPHVTMHDLRHSLASEIISSGGTLSDVQGALHHRDAVSAKRYAHLYPARLRSILLKVGVKGR